MVAFAANTKGRDSKRQGGGEIIAYPMTLSTTIYKGDIVIVAVGTGLCKSLVADASVATGDFFAGVAAETKTAAASGTTYINCYVTGTFEFLDNTDTVAVTDLGKVVEGDNSADATPSYVKYEGTGSHPNAVGVIQPPFVAAAGPVRVRIDGYAGCAQLGVAP